jgi:hypothetical protein
MISPSRLFTPEAMISSMSNEPGKIYVDWGKLVQIAIIIIAVTVLACLHVIDNSTVTLVIGAASGYVFGNGKSVREGLPTAPLLGRKPVDQQTWSLEPSESDEV